MRRISIFSGLLPVFSFSLLCSLPAVAHDFDEPKAAVNAYIKGVKTGSGELVEMAFSESARIQYYDQNLEFQSFNRDAFAKLVDTGNGWNASSSITEFKQTGNVANATVQFIWGEDNNHAYVDYLNLIFDGASWHISNKVAQYVDNSGK